MKKILFFILASLLVIPVSAHTFLGNSFGDKYSVVHLRLKSSGFETHEIQRDIFVPQEVEFAGIRFENALFSFVSDELYSVLFSYKGADRSDLFFDTYNRLKNKYGEGEVIKDETRHAVVWDLENIRIIIGLDYPTTNTKGRFALLYVDNTRSVDDEL